MKSHVLLVGRVLEDVSIRCCVSTTRDLETIVSRVEKEGDSFLTVTLPELAGVLERGLQSGRLWSDFIDDKDAERPSGRSNPRNHFGFGIKKKTCLPRFMSGVWAQVFDAKSGQLLDNPSIDAIQALRQTCNLFKKVLHPCSDAKVEAAMLRFVECDNEVGEHSKTRWMRDNLPHLTRISGVLFRDVLDLLDTCIWKGLVVPKHGPGSTADRTIANAKYDNRVWTTRLESLFYAGEFLYPSWSHFLEAESDGCGPTWLEPWEEPPVRVVSVPKTQKTPRIIAIEPVYMQYVQQGLAEILVERIEEDDLLSHFLGFGDQVYSQTLACEGSRTGDLATLDLSEASDRVSTLHVSALLREHTLSKRAVFDCRSTTAAVPGQGVISLSKYASMGSALTFPLEAMVFLCIVFRGIEQALNCQVTPKLLQELKGRVRVYGDDIIVPVDFADSVYASLEDFGLKVNRSKSFWTGKFRESCGGEYYDGFDVGYVKVRRDLPSERKHAREIISTVSTRNLFYERGYWRTAEYLDELLGRLIPFPRVGPDSPGLGRHSFLGYDVEKECPYLQRPLVKAAVAYSRIPDSEVSGTGALLKYFLKRSDEPFADKKHLERAGRPVAVNIKLRYVCSY